MQCRHSQWVAILNTSHDTWLDHNVLHNYCCVGATRPVSTQPTPLTHVTTSPITLVVTSSLSRMTSSCRRYSASEANCRISRRSFSTKDNQTKSWVESTRWDVITFRSANAKTAECRAKRSLDLLPINRRFCGDARLLVNNSLCTHRLVARYHQYNNCTHYPCSVFYIERWTML